MSKVLIVEKRPNKWSILHHSILGLILQDITIVERLTLVERVCQQWKVNSRQKIEVESLCFDTTDDHKSLTPYDDHNNNNNNDYSFVHNYDHSPIPYSKGVSSSIYGMNCKRFPTSKSKLSLLDTTLLTRLPINNGKIKRISNVCLLHNEFALLRTYRNVTSLFFTFGNLFETVGRLDELSTLSSLQSLNIQFSDSIDHITLPDLLTCKTLICNRVLIINAYEHLITRDHEFGSNHSLDIICGSMPRLETLQFGNGIWSHVINRVTYPTFQTPCLQTIKLSSIIPVKIWNNLIQCCSRSLTQLDDTDLDTQYIAELVLIPTLTELNLSYRLLLDIPLQQISRLQYLRKLRITIIYDTKDNEMIIITELDAFTRLINLELLSVQLVLTKKSSPIIEDNNTNTEFKELQQHKISTFQGLYADHVLPKLRNVVVILQHQSLRFINDSDCATWLARET